MVTPTNKRGIVQSKNRRLQGGPCTRQRFNFLTKWHWYVFFFFHMPWLHTPWMLRCKETPASFMMHYKNIIIRIFLIWHFSCRFFFGNFSFNQNSSWRRTKWSRHIPGDKDWLMSSSSINQYSLGLLLAFCNSFARTFCMCLSWRHCDVRFCVGTSRTATFIFHRDDKMASIVQLVCLY